jgi:ankyrin repeat protein
MTRLFVLVTGISFMFVLGPEFLHAEPSSSPATTKPAEQTTDGYKLLLAAIDGREAEALELIQNGVDVNYRSSTDRSKSTALFLAAASSHPMTRVIEALVKHGADVNAVCIGGFTPLHNACDQGTLKTVEYLIAHGAEVKAKDISGCTPLHAASARDLLGETDKEEMIKCLLAHGADVNAEMNNGMTPLDWATEQHSSAASLRILEAAGGKPGHANK